MGTFSRNKSRKVGEDIIEVLFHLLLPLSSSAHARLLLFMACPCSQRRHRAFGLDCEWILAANISHNFLQKSSATIAMLMLTLLGNVLMLSEGLPGVNSVFSLRNGTKLSRLPSDLRASRLAIDINRCSLLSHFVDHCDIRYRCSATRPR
jgi:hypothetical protein